MRVAVRIGATYGRWTIVGDIASSPGEVRQVVAECECGKRRPVILYSLLYGKSRSCGCLQRDVASVSRPFTHGHSGKNASLTYRTWQAMRARCTNPSSISYPLYGGRGIRVCDRWNTFELFLTDMGERPSKRHSIDRIDNEGHYEPGNCRWATSMEQQQHRRNNRLLTYNGETAPLAELARRFGITKRLLADRLDLGWAMDRALTQPARAYRQRGTRSRIEGRTQ